MKRKYLLGIGMVVAFVVVIFTLSLNSAEDMREDFISQKNKIIGLMAMQGDYDCCLEKACTYCIEKTPGHGEGAECHCREDVLNGVHPCGECIGEIMEGHGKPELSPYYAKAIAEKIDPEFEDELQEMMDVMYPGKAITPLQVYIEEEKDGLSEITCYCGCEHTSLYNCHEEGMLTNCGVCMEEFEDYQELKEEGKTIKEISDIIDERYGS